MLDYVSYIGDYRKNKHLTPIERGQIAALHSQGLTPYRIGKILHRASNTIRNELKRGTTTIIKRKYEKMEYFPERGQAIYENNRKRCTQGYKASACKEFIAYVESQVLDEKRSLDSIFGRVLKDGTFKREEMVCVKTLYNYVDAGIIKVKNIDLPVKVSRRTKKKRPYSKRYHRTDGRSIEDRPEKINSRNEFGHWEIDLVIGQNNKKDDVLLTLTERKTRKEVIRKIKNKTIEAVSQGLNEIIKEIPREALKSITSDNGVEFSRLHLIEERGIQVYYAHPYASYERGQNENTNGIIRRFVPKGTPIKGYSKEKIKKIEMWINTMPRRILGYFTAEELYQEELNGLDICA